jgi:hypothetical protein
MIWFVQRVARLFLLILGIALFAPIVLFPKNALAAPPQLWLPTPVGQQWQVMQGFYCGSHTGSQSRSLDLINLDGATSGAPVRAAADGTTFVWEAWSGTLILSHGDGYYTLYSHLQSVISTQRGVAVEQGEVIGRAGSVGYSTTPHLHFNYFYAPDSGAYQRTPLEIDFADGYEFSDTSGCSQHRGRVVVASDGAPAATDTPTPLPPTETPTLTPTAEPTAVPTNTPVPTETVEDTEEEEARERTAVPTDGPRSMLGGGTDEEEPTEEPTATPSPSPTEEPTEEPTQEPTATPSPSPSPTQEPTEEPTEEPTATATPSPSPSPTATQEVPASLTNSYAVEATPF